MSDVLAGKKVLIVDDEEFVCKSLADSFKATGAEVSTAFSAEQAIKTLSSDQYNLVVADIRMPGGSGVLILEYLNKEGFSEPKIIFITGFSDYFRDDLVKKGAVDVLPKPIKPSKLLSISRDVFV